MREHKKYRSMKDMAHYLRKFASGPKKPLPKPWKIARCSG